MTTYTNVSATDDLTVGTSLRNLGTLLQVGTATFSGGITGITTSMVTEGTNLYWTLVRFNSAFALLTTDNLLEGTTNLYYSTPRFTTDFNTKTTDDLNQGTTNKYLNDLTTTNTTEITHTFTLPILSSAINAGSIVLSKLNSSSYSTANTPNTLVQRNPSGDFNSNAITVNNITALALSTFSFGNNAQGGSYSAIFGNAARSGQIVLMDGLTYNTYAQLYCRSNIFGIQGNLGSIQLEKPTKIATSLNITNSTLVSNYCTIDSTGVNIATGLTFEINGVEYLSTKTTTDLLEGTNLYYTTARFNTELATKTTDDLNVGTTNQYYLTSLFNSDLATKTTDNLNQGTTNKYYLTSLFNSDLATKSTTNLLEGTNLYYTSSRFNSAFATKTTTDLLEGTNLYYTAIRFGFDFASKNTDYLAQGSLNKYLNAFTIADTTEINHTYTLASPILSSVINAGSIANSN